MNRRWIALAGIALVGLAALWFFFLRSDNPDPVSLEDAVASVTGSTVSEEPAATLPETTDTTAAVEEETIALDGTWTVLSDENSFAGYRVGEELASIGVTEAVGRTSGVTGSLELEGSTLTAVSIEVDMPSLRSDDNRRDGAMSRQALETNAFPTAQFVLTGAIDLGTIPSEGVPISVTASGDLTLHGVTAQVDIPLEAQLVAKQRRKQR